MNGDNAVLDRSFDFSVRIVKVYQYLCSGQKEYVLSKQLLRCGTSIGANINEAQYAISRKEFLSKMYIAFKECAETMYWLKLLFRTDYLTDGQYNSINNDCRELHALLSSITKSTRDPKNKRNPAGISPAIPNS